MGLASHWCALLREVCAEKNQPVFENAKSRHEIWMPLAGIEDLLDKLGDRDEASYPERDAITCALMVEHQSCPTEFWQVVLLVAYWPMLCRLRGMLRGGALAGDELDGLVLGAFLEVITAFVASPIPVKVAAKLKDRTRYQVFSTLKKEQRRRQVVVLVPLEELPAGELTGWPDSKPCEAECDVGVGTELAAILCECSGDVIDPGDLQMLVATLANGERLSDYIGRIHPNLPPAAALRMQARMRQRHRRALLRLRRDPRLRKVRKLFRKKTVTSAKEASFEWVRAKRESECAPTNQPLPRRDPSE